MKLPKTTPIPVAVRLHVTQTGINSVFVGDVLAIWCPSEYFQLRCVCGIESKSSAVPLFVTGKARIGLGNADNVCEQKKKSKSFSP